MDPRVKEHDHQEDDSRHGQSEQQPQKQDLVPARGDRIAWPGGSVDHPRVVVHHRLGEGVLLALVQEEEVKRLLDLLLALDREHLAFLGRDG